tara:strand:+ start:656 stop:1093 length:438 start_codon:yes stop_codon:yes gene_type:complete
LRVLEAYAAQARKRVVVVGTTVLDEQVVLSRPPKADWSQFFPFALLPMWRRAELALFRRKLNESSWTSYLDAGGIARLYPGVRCDGMHFQSNYTKQYGCHPSAAVWDVYLLQLFERLQLLQRCTHTLWGQKCTARRHGAGFGHGQ